jgi:uncharacterized protein (DUF2132 family)/predicted GNAT family acetyltransferase
MTDPLHGITLKALLQTLVERHGWEDLGHRFALRCFLHEPSMSSSLKFLRKTPWARAKVEAFYVAEQREVEKKRSRNRHRAARRAFAASMPVERAETLAFFWPPREPAPSVELPPGFTLVLGPDRAGFVAVQRDIGFVVTEPIWDAMDQVVMAVVHDKAGAVAVACGVQREAAWVELGWVAVAPEHRGRGLGRAVCSAVVAALLEAGHTRIIGSTQDERVQALRIYLAMGFSPVQRPEKAARWAAVLDAQPE